MSVCWNITTDHNAKPIRHRYMGVGCYRRKVDVPAAWRGKRIWLKIGGGSVPVGDQAIGAVRKIAEVSFKVPSVTRPVKATLTLALTSQSSRSIANSWPCWIFPVREKKDG